MANPSLISVLWKSYCLNTDRTLKLIDCFLVYFLAVCNLTKVSKHDSLAERKRRWRLFKFCTA